LDENGKCTSTEHIIEEKREGGTEVMVSLAVALNDLSIAKRFPQATFFRALLISNDAFLKLGSI